MRSYDIIEQRDVAFTRYSCFALGVAVSLISFPTIVEDAMKVHHCSQRLCRRAFMRGCTRRFSQHEMYIVYVPRKVVNPL